MKPPKKTLHALITAQEEKRILAAKKQTPIVNKSDFIRLLINEALTARGF